MTEIEKSIADSGTPAYKKYVSDETSKNKILATVKLLPTNKLAVAFFNDYWNETRGTSLYTKTIEPSELRDTLDVVYGAHGIKKPTCDVALEVENWREKYQSPSQEILNKLNKFTHEHISPLDNYDYPEAKYEYLTIQISPIRDEASSVFAFKLQVVSEYSGSNPLVVVDKSFPSSELKKEIYDLPDTLKLDDCVVPHRRKDLNSAEDYLTAVNKWLKAEENSEIKSLNLTPSYKRHIRDAGTRRGIYAEVVLLPNQSLSTSFFSDNTGTPLAMFEEKTLIYKKTIEPSELRNTLEVVYGAYGIKKPTCDVALEVETWREKYQPPPQEILNKLKKFTHEFYYPDKESGEEGEAVKIVIDPIRDEASSVFAFNLKRSVTYPTYGDEAQTEPMLVVDTSFPSSEIKRLVYHFLGELNDDIDQADEYVRAVTKWVEG